MFIPAFISAIDTPEEHDAVERMFHEHYRRMWCVAFSVLRNDSDAEDAVMSVFESIAKSPSKYICENFDEQAALLYMVVKNRAIDLYRHKDVIRRHTVMEKEIGASSDQDAEPPATLLIDEETKAAMWRAMQALDEECRTPLVLKYYYGFTNHEICDLLQINYNTVNGRIFRAKKLLKMALKKQGYIE